jgi:DNA polymerase III subunit gamma/tau
MSYQVTARKWRPQTFTELVGQDHVARTLQNALRLGRMAHAYLFTGTRGVGKTTTARILAKTLNCEQGPTAEPCNQCTLCQAITLGSSLDVLEIDGASNRGIDEIRDLREKIRYAPARGRYKIYIIDEVHMLTEHAFNALLKTLEEPPPQVVFIFATTEPQKVPITILSRCQRFDFRKVASTEISACLAKIAQQEGIHIGPNALHQIARRAEGSLRDAQTLFDQVITFCGPEIEDPDVASLLGLAGEEQILRLMEAILARDACTALTVLTHLLQRGFDTRDLCRQLLEAVRDMLVVKVAPSGQGILDRSPAELEGLQKLGAQASIDELHTLFELLAATEGRVRDSAQPIWMLEVSLIKLAALPHLQSLSTLLARLESLEQRLGQGGEPATTWLPSPPPLMRETASEPAAPGTSALPALDQTPPASPPHSPAVPGDERPPQLDTVKKIIESASTRPLGWILEQHCTLQLTESTLEVIFRGNNRMARELLQEGETLRILQQLACTAAGREITLRVVDAPEANDERSPASRHHAQPVENPVPLTRAPIVRDTLDLFGGRILEVRQRTVRHETFSRPMAEDEMVHDEEGDDE